jgi:hypothetical protein
MVEAGSGRAVMGNHEFNAIAWATPDRDHTGHHLRRRTEKNHQQHQAFLVEIGPDSPDHEAWVLWFMDLPLWIEEPGFRVVHACWSPRHVELLRPHLLAGERLTLELVEAASRRNSVVHSALETLLKGIEVELPEGHFIRDREGHQRTHIRTKWWNAELATYRSAFLGPPGFDLPDTPIPVRELPPQPDRPTFIGHYWFDPKGPFEPVTKHVACVDFSAGTGGPLTAYRYDGESELSAEKFFVA